MSLVAILLPLIPGLVQGVLSLVDAIKNHADTPEAAKAQLEQISAQLAIVKAQVAAVQV